jgi:hypothetical protein
MWWQIIVGGALWIVIYGRPRTPGPARRRRGGRAAPRWLIFEAGGSIALFHGRENAAVRARFYAGNTINTAAGNRSSVPTTATALR